MKLLQRLTRIVQIVAPLFLSASLLHGADQRIKFEAQPGSTMRLDGTSSLHDWTVKGSIIKGQLEADPGFPKDPAVVSKVKPSVQVTVPVRSLKSDKKAMDNVMYEAMKEKEFRAIEYRLKEMTLKSKPGSAGGPYLFDTKGELIIAGVTKPNAMVVAMEKLAGDKLKFIGTNTVKMTDFGIKPPSIPLLMIKTGDDVKIIFEWLVAPGTGEPAKAP